MKRLFGFLVTAAALLAQGTVQQSVTQLGTTGNWVVAFSWKGDSSTGAVQVTKATLQGCCQGYYITQVEVTPGSPAPTNGYSLAIISSAGIDALAGGATGLSSTVAQSFAASSASAPIQGSFTLAISGQNVASARGAVYVYLSATPRTIVSGGSGGSATPGGSSGQIQGNCANAFCGFTVSGDFTLTTSGTGTLATVNSSPGACGDSTHACIPTIDGKGRVTSPTTTPMLAGIVAMTTAAGAPTANCTAPSTSNLAMYTDSTAHELWACLSSGTGGAGWVKIPGLTPGTPVMYAGAAQTDPCGTVASGQGCLWFDATNKAVQFKNDAQVVSSTIVTNSFCASGQHVDGYSSDGTKHCTADSGGTLNDGGATALIGNWSPIAITNGQTIAQTANTTYVVELPQPVPQLSINNAGWYLETSTSAHHAWAIWDVQAGAYVASGMGIGNSGIVAHMPMASGTFQFQAFKAYLFVYSSDTSGNAGLSADFAYDANDSGVSRAYSCATATTWVSGVATFPAMTSCGTKTRTMPLAMHFERR